MVTRPLLTIIISGGILITRPTLAQDIDQIRDAFNSVREQAGLAGPTLSPTNGVATASVEPPARQWFPIASHSKVNEGIPFPPVDSIVWDPDPPGLRELWESTPRAEPVPIATPYQRPSRCERNYTTRSVMYSDSREERDKPLYDTLYLAEDMIPLDPAEVYGARARLYPYGPTSGEGVYLRMESDRVPCVPYRVRMTNAARYEDFGLNALKNYTKDQSGQGLFDPWVSNKLFGRKR